jgi:hypothetical protein
MLSLVLSGCFEQAPTIEAGTTDGGSTSGVGASTSSGGGSEMGSDEASGTETGSGETFCAGRAGAIACLDFEGNDAIPPIAEQTARNGGTLGILEDGFESMRALVAVLDGMPDGVAALRIEHREDTVRHGFALRLEPGCVPPAAGLVLASYATYVMPQSDATRVELVLLPDNRIGVRKGSSMTDADPGPIVAEIASPPIGEWAVLAWGVDLDNATIGLSISDGTESDSGSVVAIGVLGDGRRSGIGLGSRAATTCTATFDNVVFEVN